MSDVDMAIIPASDVTLNDLFEWYKSQEELNKAKAREALLRSRVFKHFFPTPKEGTNTLELDPVLVAAGFPADGRVLKGVHTVNRSVDEAALVVLTPTFIEKKIPVDKLIKRKPELAKGEYNNLTKEEKQLFDQVLVVKDGTPSMEVVLPAKRKG